MGPYGKAKHQFLIDLLRPLDMVMDDDWLYEVMPSNPPDMGLTAYWCGFFTDALKAENRRRLDAGLDYLREAPAAGATEGAIVVFYLNGTAQPYI